MTADEVKSKEQPAAEENTVEVELPELARPLEKMTVKELREIGLKVPTMVGVHSMKKAELVEKLMEVYGIEVETKTGHEGIKELKAKIREMRTRKAEALEAGDKNRINVYRRKINRLKKQTRKMARTAAA